MDFKFHGPTFLPQRRREHKNHLMPALALHEQRITYTDPGVSIVTGENAS